MVCLHALNRMHLDLECLYLNLSVKWYLMAERNQPWLKDLWLKETSFIDTVAIQENTI